MYVKLFNQILDSSIADDRRLRHFFTDLLLCSDAKGYVMMTEAAIARRIGATIDEVEWGIAELEKPDERSKTPESEGRRIERLEGIGYGWRILNYEQYRAMKDGDQMREATKQRVKRYRENKNHSKNVTLCNASVTHGNAITEGEAEAEEEAEEKRVCATQIKKPPHIDLIPDPEPETPSWKQDDPMHTLMRRINALMPAWSKPSHWNASEMHMLHGGTAAQMSELTKEDWESLGEYLRKPQEKGLWQPHTRSKFVETFPDVWQAVQRWQSSKPKKITINSDSTFY